MLREDFVERQAERRTADRQRAGRRHLRRCDVNWTEGMAETPGRGL
jgi:hypothetical protein